MEFWTSWRIYFPTFQVFPTCNLMLPNQTGYGNIAIALNFLVAEMMLNGTFFPLQTYLKKMTCKGTLWQVFIRGYRLVIQ
jgi:hypothetical protein